MLKKIGYIAEYLALVLPDSRGMALLSGMREGEEILLEDDLKRRFVTTIPYRLTNLMDRKKTAAYCAALGVWDTGMMLYSCGSCKRTCTEEIVPASVTASSGKQRIGSGLPCLLAEIAESVVFSEDPDDRAAAAVRAAESRRNLAEVFCHLKTEVTELFTV